jgi:hypothetical protein
MAKNVAIQFTTVAFVAPNLAVSNTTVGDYDSPLLRFVLVV